MTMFLHELPYKPRVELCNVLDYQNEWKTLGGIHMKFDCYILFKMEQAIQRNRSPTEELLSKWSVQNHTVVELFQLLYEMKHFQAMTILKPFVPSKYHRLIPDLCPGRSNTQVTQRSEREEVASHEHSKTLKQNMPKPIPQPPQQEVPNRENVFNETTRKVSDPLSPLCSLGTPHISYVELTKATNNWDKDQILGSGGFGTVYKGIWKNMAVAIKILNVLKEGKPKEETDICQREQSLRELKYLNSCRHDNILSLYGVCFEQGHYCLVYKFMPNGSLDDRLRNLNKSPPLSWPERLNIAIGTAAGIDALHSMNPPLVHGDIKSANILLDAHMEPVIGDFGLTQEGPIAKATHITLKKINGTQAYLPHEFLQTRKLSPKVDVYSYGIVCYELATGMKAVFTIKSGVRKTLKETIHQSGERLLPTLYDSNAQPLDTDIAYNFIKIGKLCVQESAKQRPDIIQVYNMLKCERDGQGPSNQHTRMPNSLYTNQASKLSRVGQSTVPPNVVIGQNIHGQPTVPFLQQTNGQHLPKQPIGLFVQQTNALPLPKQSHVPTAPLHINGTIAPQHKNGTISPQNINGPIATQHINGTISPQHINGPIATQHINGTIAPQHINGSIPHQNLNGLLVQINGVPLYNIGKSVGTSQQQNSQIHNLQQIQRQLHPEQPLEASPHEQHKPSAPSYQRIRRETDNTPVEKISELGESQSQPDEDCSGSHSSCPSTSDTSSVELLEELLNESQPVVDIAPTAENNADISVDSLPLFVKQMNIKK